jgi:hypothetical protein
MNFSTANLDPTTGRVVTGPRLLCPFDLRVTPIARFLNCELVDHPVYDGLELQYFDDPPRGLSWPPARTLTWPRTLHGVSVTDVARRYGVDESGSTPVAHLVSAAGLQHLQQGVLAR